VNANAWQLSASTRHETDAPSEPRAPRAPLLLLEIVGRNAPVDLGQLGGTDLDWDPSGELPAGRSIRRIV